MSKITRLAVLMAASISLFAAVSSSAGAVTWHNTGNTAFHATAGQGTLSATGTNGLACPSGGTMAGAVGATPAGFLTWTLATVTVKWSNCQLGTTGWSVDCSFTTTAHAFFIGVALTEDITCTLYLSGVAPCRVNGVLGGHYTNPVSPSTFGRFTITTGGNLTVTNGGGGTCPLGTNDKGHLSEQTFVIDGASGGTGTLGPIITRTS